MSPGSGPSKGNLSLFKLQNIKQTRSRMYVEEHEELFFNATIQNGYKKILILYLLYFLPPWYSCIDRKKTYNCRTRSILALV